MKTGSFTALGIAVKTVLLLFLYQNPPLQAQKLYTAERIEQGSVLQSFIYPVGNLTDVEFILLNSRGKVVAKSQGFLLNYKRGTLAKKRNGRMKNWVQLGLIGITSAQSSGDYTLRATIAKKSLRSQVFEHPVYIQKRDFPQQTIKVSEKMDNLLNTSDPDTIAKKRSQAQRLWTILKRNNAEALHYGGILERPIAEDHGWTSSPYGYVRKYIYPGGKEVNSIHKGHDIAAARGIHVLASAAGLVVMAQERIVTGKTVMLAILPGVFLKYQHLSTINVSEGDMVQKGELLGEVGKTGFATGNHLHVELWVSSGQVEPSAYFTKPLIDTNEIISMIAEN